MSEARVMSADEFMSYASTRDGSTLSPTTAGANNAAGSGWDQFFYGLGGLALYGLRREIDSNYGPVVPENSQPQLRYDEHGRLVDQYGRVIGGANMGAGFDLGGLKITPTMLVAGLVVFLVLR